jgi:hypothetical protein
MARVYVDTLGDGSEGRRVTLGIEYAGRVARIEIEPSEPIHEGESAAEIYRRDLIGLIAALDDWEAAKEPVQIS